MHKIINLVGHPCSGKTYTLDHNDRIAGNYISVRLKEPRVVRTHTDREVAKRVFQEAIAASYKGAQEIFKETTKSINIASEINKTQDVLMSQIVEYRDMPPSYYSIAELMVKQTLEDIEFWKECNVQCIHHVVTCLEYSDLKQRVSDRYNLPLTHQKVIKRSKEYYRASLAVKEYSKLMSRV